MPHDHPAVAALERVIADGSRLAAAAARQADLDAAAPVSYSLTPLAMSALSGTGQEQPESQCRTRTRRCPQMTTDLYRRPRTPQEERRLQDLTDQLIATGTVAPDDSVDGGKTRAPAAARPAPAAAGQSCAQVSHVHPHPDNIRSEIGDIEETAASIMAHGILQPLTVESVPGMPGHWRVIAGHRRLAAAKAAGLQVVPITVREPDGAEPEALMLIENCHRRDLPVMDKAEAMGALKSKGYSVAKIARSTGFAEATVYSYMALLDLDARTRAMVRDGRLSAADALAGVRAARKRQRKKAGRPAVGPLWEPDHFTGQHQLARKARALCDAREHTARRRVGKVACGQCWETVIRQDERTAEAALAASRQGGGRCG